MRALGDVDAQGAAAHCLAFMLHARPCLTRCMLALASHGETLMLCKHWLYMWM